jgi:hypothetical protein
MCILPFITGCEPGEGEVKYKNKFLPLLSAPEAAIYKKVQKEWDYSYLMPIRNAIYLRLSAPADTDLPFYDIAPTLVFMNEKYLKEKNKDFKSKNILFSDINESWWAALVSNVEKSGIDLNQMMVDKDKQIIVTIYDGRPQKNLTTPQPPKVEVKKPDIKETNIDKVDVSELLPYTEYEMLMKETKTCSYATEMLLKKLRGQRYLFKQDKDEIMREVLFCKNIELQQLITTK